MIDNKILFLGKVPPPAGGLGIHLQRLMESLGKDNIKYGFHDFRKHRPLTLFSTLMKYEVGHIHVSNSYFRFCLIILLNLFGVRSVFTFHGNVGRYGDLRNFIDLLSFKISNNGIVINQSSFERVKHIKGVKYIPAFIPPITTKPLQGEIVKAIHDLKSKSTKLYATNANGLSYDIDGREIYGIFSLVEVFKDLPHSQLLFVSNIG